MNIITAFLGVTTEAAPPQPERVDMPSGTAIILFADIVDSTALTERLGDTAFREKARGLDAAMRGAIRAERHRHRRQDARRRRARRLHQRPEAIACAQSPAATRAGTAACRCTSASTPAT